MTARPMRVLHAHSGNVFGGIETALLALAGATGAGLEHEFALAFDDRLAGRLRADGRTVYPLGPVRLSRPWTTWRARRRLRQVFQRVRPDMVVVHSVWSLVAFGPEARRHTVPLAAWLHAAPTGDLPLDRLARRVPPDVVVANSRYTAAAVPRLFPELPTRIVYPPVAPRIAPSAERRESRPSGARGPGPKAELLQVGRLDRGKGQHILLEALPAVPGEWRCRFVGGTGLSGRYQRDLHEHARRLGLGDRVEFLGARDDAPALIARADLLVHPNIEPESFGIVFVEAMQAGVPVVASATGAAPEVVTDDTGVLIPPGDIAELRDVLTRLIQEPALRERLARAGPARARALCDPAARARDLAAVLRTVVH